MLLYTNGEPWRKSSSDKFIEYEQRWAQAATKEKEIVDIYIYVI